jgi:AcrR family transcriptional regulator
MAKIASSKNGTKKQVIIEKAAWLFKSKSYSATSMRELAEALGVEAPSLYNHIGSKSELLEAICFKVGDQFTEQIGLIEKHPAGALDRIEAIIRFHIQMMLENFDEVYVANHEWKHLREPLLSDFLAIRRNYEKALTALVAEGIRNSEIRLVNPWVAVLTILSAVRGIEFWQRNHRNVPEQELEDDMVNHLLKGIAI